MKCHLSIISLILSILYSCSPGAKEKSTLPIEVVEISEGLENTKRINLSKIANKVQYIPLETNEESILQNINKLELIDSTIFISDEKQLMLFTDEGKFVTKVGREGKGPGEYIRIYDFAIFPKIQKIYIYDMDQRKIIIYDYEGNYESEIKFTTYPRKIANINNILVALWVRPYYAYNDNFGIEFYTPKGELISRNFNRSYESLSLSEAKNAPSSGGCTTFSVYNDTLTYWEMNFDTLYHIVDNGIIVPKYYLKTNNQISVEEMSQSNIPNEGLFLCKIIECSNYLFMPGCIYNNELKHLVYDKSTHEIFNLYFDHDDMNLKLHAGYYNDIDGGFPFLPQGVLNDGRLYCSFYAYELISYMKTEPFKSIEVKDDNKAKELNEILENSAIQDNPIIMIVSLED